MSKLRLMVMAAGGLAMALVAAPIGVLHSQVGAPGNYPRTPTTGPVTTSQAQADIRADLPFMQEVASANLMEVRLGELAQQRALTPAVKQFGQRMVSDHSSLQSQ
jgi:putative membrane protein